MANVEINDVAAKTTPVTTDEILMQETGGGTSKKATLANVTKGLSASSATAQGAVELATTAETTTGTDATRAVTPDGLKDGYQGSTNIDTLGTVTTGDVDAAVTAASTTAAGKVEISTAAENNTGTDAGRAVSPDSLAGSYAGTVSVIWNAVEGATDCAVADDVHRLYVPDAADGMNLVGVQAYAKTAGTTGTMDVQIHNLTQTADMLSTVITLDTTEATSRTAAAPAVIDAANDDVAAGDIIRIDIDAVQTTAAKGLWVELEFRLP